ncbi:MAG: hypothetical protein J0M04_00690 [Verrucomicrobia bacterium]|nr:hypothetical protein [Verrucomicrobiota bacterium]
MSDGTSSLVGEAPQDAALRGFLAAVALVLVVASHLVWSSPEYRQQHLLLAGLLAMMGFRGILWPLLRKSGARGALAVAGLLIAHAASWIGGVWNGVPPVAATGAAAQGLIGAVGLAVLVAVLVEKRFHRYAKWTGFAVLALIVTGSFIGYLVSIERYIELGGYGNFYSQLRMALIWPTRMLTAAFGQIAWDNANYAAYYFALAFALLLESMADGGVRNPWMRWGWCVALVAGVYLTASRSGAMMGCFALALVLPGRPLRFLLRTLAVVALGIAVGYGGLHFKENLISPKSESLEPASRAEPPKSGSPSAPRPKPPPPKVPDPGKRVETTEDHTSAYLKRASAGRTKIYLHLWKSMAASRWCGKGLAVTGKDVDFLNHEHSSYVATFRGGGLVALAGHTLALAAAAWGALRLWRRHSLRWPAVLLVVATGGLLFDRSSVIALTGNYEFLSHWVAVWVAVLLAPGESGASD